MHVNETVSENVIDLIFKVTMELNRSNLNQIDIVCKISY